MSFLTPRRRRLLGTAITMLAWAGFVFAWVWLNFNTVPSLRIRRWSPDVTGSSKRMALTLAMADRWIRTNAAGGSSPASDRSDSRTSTLREPR